MGKSPSSPRGGGKHLAHLRRDTGTGKPEVFGSRVSWFRVRVKPEQTRTPPNPYPRFMGFSWVIHGSLKRLVWSSIFPFLGATDIAKCWLELRVELFQATA